MTKTAQKLIEELQELLLRQLKALRKTDTRPLTEMIGAGKGLYESPEQVDDQISKQREEWDY